MVKRLLARSTWRYFFKHPWVIMLSILGVSIGVAVVVSVDIANGSAQKAFQISVQNLTGAATHQVIGGPLGLDETLYFRMKLAFPDLACSPVVDGYVSVKGETLEMLGFDVFSDASFSSELSGLSSDTAVGLIARPGTALMAKKTADRLGISAGDTITVSVGGQQKAVTVIGLIGTEADSTLDGFMAADISAAQELLGKVGLIDRINLILPENDAQLQSSIQTWLPDGVSLVATAVRNQSTLKVTSAFTTNLSAMSLLALLVGMFLIYNTMTFSVLQRRQLLGSLRILGVTRREIFTEVLLEAGVIGFIGTSLGVVLGILLGQGMVKLVMRTVNDLYFQLTVSTFVISAATIAKGMLLGVAVSLVAAFIPALEASTSPPQVARFRSVIESLTHRLLPYITLFGIGLMAVSIAILFLSGKSVVAGFVALFMLVIGFALCIPVVVNFISRAVGSFTGRRTGGLSKIATMGVSDSLSRTGTAMAALAVAISVIVGMGTMIDSFRGTVDRWLGQALSGDVYVTTTSDVSRRSENPIPEDIVARVLAMDGIEAVKEMKTIYLDTPTSLVEVQAIDPVAQAHSEYWLKEGREDTAWAAFEAGDSIFVAEPYAYKNNIKLGGTVSFSTEEGEKSFTVAGIFYDYSSDSGIILMPLKSYAEYWHDSSVSSMSLYLAPGVDKTVMLSAIRGVVDGSPGVLVRYNTDIKNAGLRVFDQTFLITRVLEFLAIIVAFIGILSTLMAYQLEKIKEIGILRATGVTPRQIWRLIGLQTGFMGTLSGILAVPLGMVMAILLISVINIRSFGWSVQMAWSSSSIVEAMAVAIGAALLASIYPAWRMSRISPAEALREE